MVGSFVLQFRQPDRIPLDHIIHHGSQMDAQATSTAGAEHIINGMILVEINLNEDHTIDDMFCTCGAGSLCVHLAAMMYDMVERDTIRLSELENK